MLAKIINAGYSEDLPPYLKSRVQPTNIVAVLIIFAIGIPFIVLTPIYFPKELTSIPLFGTLTCVGVVIANHWGGIRYSRPILSVVPVSTGFIYNMLLCGPNDDPIYSVYLITLAFSLVPFVTMDIREQGFLLIASLYSFIVLVGFPITRNWATIEADTTVIREGWLSYVTISLGVITALGCMVGLTRINKKAEQEIELSRIEAEERNATLLNQQRENQQKTKELESAQAEERKRQWAAEGLSQISEIVRNATGDHSLFDQLVAKTVKYLQANQGGLFVVDRSQEANIRIELAACYAYERKKFLEKTIAPGEGLVGQAYLEQDYLHFTKIPADYVNITSGLGKATPTSLLIIPLKVNEEVEGLLELASFQHFEEHEIAFLKKLGEVIGSYIQNQRVMLQTQQLLAQAQEQGEEMRAQEEEMRQNMEELQATQEEMHRKEKEYQAQIQELQEQIAAS